MNEIITTAAELAVFALGTAFTDCQGDVWIIDTHTRNGQTYLIGPETGSYAADALLKKWGPLTLRWCPDAEPTTDAEFEAWNAGFEAAATWTPAGPSGIPNDPPVNPYAEGGAR